MSKKGAIIKCEPIREPLKIEQMKDMLLKNYDYRDYLLFVTGINVGMRITDLLRLKFKDFKGSHFTIIEEKTEKKNTFKVNKQLAQLIEDYGAGKNENDFIFRSRDQNKPISRQYAHRILKEAGNRCGMDYVATHTMRKTFGYFFYKHTKDIAQLQTIFNHSAPSITKRYIGITREEIDNVLEGFSIGL